MNLPTRITAQALLGLMLIASPSASADTCDSTRRALDTQIADAGSADPRHDRFQSIRWLRQTPFLHAELLDAADDRAAIRFVLDAMAELDRATLLLELGGAAANAPPVRCWTQAVDRILSTPEALTSLRDQTPADLYRTWPRALGPYLVAKPFLRRGAARWRARERAAIAQGRAAARVAFKPAAAAMGNRAEAMTALTARLRAARARHPLAWPALPPDQLTEAFALFAPALHTSDTHAYARIGRLEGHAGRPRVDTSMPVGYTEASYVRHGGKVLLQLTYSFWFTERPRTGVLDPYGGPIDGIVLRATLSEDGRPLIWESIHPCGCYYTLFLPEDRPIRYEAPASSDPEPAIVLTAPDSSAPIALHYTPDTHYARFMTEATEEGASVASFAYALADYDELLRPGATRPPFGRDGILRGTARQERWFLWPSGVASPGAMRSSGRQATAFLGKRRFDRAELLGGRLRTAAAP
ncbi:MAG: hypothetical protein VX766_01290 [Pseudomonadota bacterium]|nr:hypothetical protein [Pseudomonadota bacterium]